MNTVYRSVEIIVVDNGSSDNSIVMVKTNFPNVRVIQSEHNRGYAGGCNLGAEHARGKYLVMLNNDTDQDPHWLEYLVEFMEKNSLISSVQPKILNHSHRRTFDYAGGCGGLMDIFCFPFSRGRIFDKLEKDTGQYDDRMEIFWASGTAFITRAEIFRKMGGFDEKMFAHMEEIDYHWKCRLAGFSVWVDPRSVVWHQGGATLKYGSPKKTYLNHRNSLILLLTNYQLINSLFLFIPRLLMELVSMAKEITGRRFHHAWSHIRALFWLPGHIPYLRRRRKQVRALRKRSDYEIMKFMYRRSIVWDYFAGKKTTWTELIEVKKQEPCR